MMPVSVRATDCPRLTEELSILDNGETVGSLLAETGDCRSSVTYNVSNNGRGPNHAEDIVYGPHDIPTRYSVAGKSAFGGEVDELYELNAGRAVWRSQADHGQTDNAVGRLYLVNDSSPFGLAVYARALLASPNGTLPTVPDGELRITKVDTKTFSLNGRDLPVTFFRIDGRDYAPDYVVIDEENELFATQSQSAIAIRKGWEAAAADLKEDFQRLIFARARQLQDSLGHKSDLPVRIRNVRIFKPAFGTLSDLSDVTIEGDSITDIRPTESADSAARKVRVVEGSGGVLVPGLHDMHSHNSVYSGLLYLASGVTTVRDMGNDNAILLQMAGAIRAGEIAGPDIVYNGFIEGRSLYSARSGVVADTLDEALDAVRWYRKHDYWQIKIYNSFPPDWVKPVAGLAHSLGMGVTGHTPAFTTPDKMIDAGYDEIAHLNQLMLGWLLKPEEDTRTTLRLTALQRAADLDLSSDPVLKTIRHMQRKHIALDTTAVILEQLMVSRAGVDPHSFAEVIDHLPVSYRRDTRRTYMAIASVEEDARYKKAFETFIGLIRLLHTNGITLLPGTDHGEGFALDRELELYVQAGMSPAEVLTTATLGMAHYLGRDRDFGSIEIGKRADMMLIQHDPTRDISAIRRPSMVFKGGYMYFPSEIYRALNIKPFTEPPTVADWP
tara:strand:+ start:46741 stop:48744 length:2004 start_codon:yes stop_codon:yes gene_type:complete